MIERGKFRSLTLINWNGFFARTFDLDQLVTTLSGGNGAGKSTTMAAFVTAMIPDLTLLHFRNTTEAGATTGSRDKGLHGKLRPGVCYSLLDVVNSRHQRVIVGVRLQQIAGRDRKVDIKPFAISRLPSEIQATQLVTELLAERQARIRNLNELKEHLDTIDGVEFKLFNSITDYHAFMFDLGVLPRRLRSAADRSKFYRLIEASLYGGISSAITRSLRDYLLPENSGVRKAFQDMESALRENRLTLEAIRVTQSDRDLFKHLISEATHYVAADYMRHANERSGQVEQLLQVRRDWQHDRQQLSQQQQQHIAMAAELAEQKERSTDLETDYQSSLDHLNLVQSAKRHQEKMLRYQDDLAQLTDNVEQQQQQTLEEQAINEEQQAQVEQLEQEVDELKSQLADYQQALDVQQTRSLQYQQAQQALERANQLMQKSVTVDSAAKELASTEQALAKINEKLLAVTQKWQVAQTANQQFEQAYQLVQKIAGETPRQQAWQVASSLLTEAHQQRHVAQQLADWQYRTSELEQRHQQQQQLAKSYQQLQKLLPASALAQPLDQVHEQLSAQLESLQQDYHQQQGQEKHLQQELAQIAAQMSQLTAQAPQWLTAQAQLDKLRQQSEQPLVHSQQVTALLQSLLEKERQITIERDVINQQRILFTDQITKLNQPSGAEDGRLTVLAERFSGVLLSEIYEDVSIDDAPYFSALYGPSRHAIVVADLAKIQPQLEQLTDCPDDLYFIEGDPQAFDDSVFDTQELAGAILVKTASRQWRYSRFPQVPLFGRAAREKQLAILQEQQQALDEQFANLSFDLQKTQRLSGHVSEFVGQYLNLAFQDDPEQAMKVHQRRKAEIERELNQQRTQQQQYQQQTEGYKQQLNLVNRLLPQWDLLQDDSLLDRLEEMQEQLIHAQQAQQFLQQHDKALQQLAPLLSALQSDPQQFATLQQQQQQVAEQQTQLQQCSFALSEVVQRRAHFSYQDAAGMLTENADLNEQLRQRLTTAEQQRAQAKSRWQQQQDKLAQCQQLLASLKSAYAAKHEILLELQQELSEFGVPADEASLQRAQAKRDELHGVLQHHRERCQQLDKQLVINEAQMEGLQKRVRQLQRDYQLLRQQVVNAKASWCKVMRLIKEHGLQQRLHRRELAYVDADELRSISDKALGALRLAVADNELLRDALRSSEGNKQGEGKIRFFIAVYQHLRERIRQDIIRTDDPLDAIEQMEIELARLTEELTAREQKLSISAQSVASIIRKTIQREQNRIRQLNQGLQTVAFGQVKSVRLNVTIRETHASLLEALAEQQEQHQDLFESPRLTFSEALAKLYQRLNPQVDVGQRTAQTLGEELLDYRNYLTMEVEVYRGADGWLRAESGALSTGEAIGTGMAILVMVVQSWEEESQRLRGKEIIPCRLLFLDEAARLDAKSIATLFELCERLQMQLIIAAPENISPEKGTTYKLVRKVFQNQEHVHVVGLRGFVNGAPNDNAEQQQPVSLN